MEIFDSHTHYEDAMFDTDRFERLEHLRKTDVKYILNCCSDVSVMPTVIDIVEKVDFAYGSIGVHPHWVCDNPPDYLEIIKEYVNHEKIVAIGEIGLDYFWNEPVELQKEVFCRQLELVKDLDMPVIIHDRDAHRDTIEILKMYRPKGILHRYSGPTEILQTALDMGMYVSFNNDLTYPDWNKRPMECLMITPWDRLLIETDCPYAPPYERENDRCESYDALRVIYEVARIRKVSPDFVARVSVENALRVYGIDG